MDYKNALMVFYVIMVAPYFEKFFSCDLQRLLTNNMLAKHITAILSVFFVITLVSEDSDKDSKESPDANGSAKVPGSTDQAPSQEPFYYDAIPSSPSPFSIQSSMPKEKPVQKRRLSDYIKNTLLIYAIYLASTKAKLYFVLPMLAMLIIDQVLEVYAKNDLKDRKQSMGARLIERVRKVFSVLIMATIAAGLAHYLIRAIQEFGSQFSWVTFFAGSYKCKGIE
jgi:hypothetical protein